MRRLCFAFVCIVSLCLAVPATTHAFEGITIEAESNDPPYDRKLYKYRIDADEDGEDTRQEVLIEESLMISAYSITFFPFYPGGSTYPGSGLSPF